MSLKYTLAILAMLPALSLAQPKTSDITCPCMDAIRSVPLEQISNMGGHDWFVAAINQYYGTTQTWRFGVIVKANSEGEAIMQGNQLLSSFTYENGPTYFQPSRSWICYYKNASGKKANATGK